MAAGRGAQWVEPCYSNEVKIARSAAVQISTRFHDIKGSDIGYWALPDMTEVREEAYELFKKGLPCGLPAEKPEEYKQ